MSVKFSTRHAFFGTLDGLKVSGLVGQGVTPDQLPESDEELRSAYAAAAEAYKAYVEAEEALFDVARQSSANPEIRSPWHGRAQTQ